MQHKYPRERVKILHFVSVERKDMWAKTNVKYHFLGGLSLHFNHLINSIKRDKWWLAIWDTSFWTFLVKFEHKGPWDIA